MHCLVLISSRFLFSEYFKHERRKHNSIHHSYSSSQLHSNKSPHSYHGNPAAAGGDDSNHSNGHSRHKRSMSWERNVEVLVVTDYLMASYHGNDLQHYVLTLMSIVSTQEIFLNMFVCTVSQRKEKFLLSWNCSLPVSLSTPVNVRDNDYGMTKLK